MDSEMKMIKGINYMKMYKNINTALNNTQYHMYIDEQIESNKIYNNQIETAKNIVNLFKEDINLIGNIVIAPTQSGKTGVMMSFINEYIKEFQLNIENVYIITGLSSNEWKKQTTERCQGVKVHHRCNLENFFNEIKNLTNLMIIIDELHVAKNEDQTVCKELKKIYKDNDDLIDKNIKFVEFTATPSSVLNDIRDRGWNEIYMEPGNRYNRLSDFKIINSTSLRMDRKLNTLLPNSIKALDKLNEMINEEFENDPKYCFIRTVGGCTQNLIVEHIKKYENIDCYMYNTSSDDIKKDINEIIKDKPSRHTYIIVSGKLRCAKTLDTKTHIGAVYDHTNNVDACIQGLAGRMTGYDNDVNCIIFTNIRCVKKYTNSLDNKFKHVNISTKTTRFSTKVWCMEDGREKKMERTELEPIVKIFDKYSKVKQFYNDHIKKYIGGSGPREIKPNEDNIYIYGNVKRQISKDEFDQLKNQWIGQWKKQRPYRLIPFYEDVDDPSTLKFGLVYLYIDKNGNLTDDVQNAIV